MFPYGHSYETSEHHELLVTELYKSQEMFLQNITFHSRLKLEMLEVKVSPNWWIQHIESEQRQLFYVKNPNYRFIPSNFKLSLFADIASGTSVDWAFNEFSIPLGYTFEFIGLGYGFVLPPEHILRNCHETKDAIVAMVAKSRELGYMNVKP